MQGLYVSLLGYLVLETRRDIKEREISVISSFIWGIMALVQRVCMGIYQPGRRLLIILITAVLPGLMLFLLAKVTEEAIGYGDAMMMLICGLHLGGKQATVIFLTGLLLMFPVSLFFLVTGRRSKEYELPFAPFLLAGFLIWAVLI